jgi:predicted esterase
MTINLPAALALLTVLPGTGPGAPAKTDKGAPEIDLKTASSHPIRYYLSLPRRYARQPGKGWPVLVCVDGAGSGFRGLAGAFGEARGDLPFLLVCPCTFSNTNALQGHMREHYRGYYADAVIADAERDRLAWDAAGLRAILQDLRADCQAEDRFFLTGMSGGGHLTYWMIFQHPDLLAGAAPVCGNFAPATAGSSREDLSAEELSLPVLVISGEKDPHRRAYYIGRFVGAPGPDFAAVAGTGLILGWLVWRKTRRRKWVAAVALPTLLGLGLLATCRLSGLDAQKACAQWLLDHRGYTNVQQTEVPGMGHDIRPGLVIDTFRPYWEGRKKRGDPPAPVSSFQG